MAKEKPILKAKKVLPMSKQTQERLKLVADRIKGKELFPEKVEMAKRTLSKLKSLPS